MARPPSKKLFNLIRSLTKNERRYVSLSLGKLKSGNPNKNLLLFNLILKQKRFDDDTIKQQLYPNRKVSTSTYATLKDYLYESILRALIHYDESNSLEISLQIGLQKIKALYKRGLINESKAYLDMLYTKAKKINDPNSLIELSLWSKKLATATLDINFLNKNSDKIDQQIDDALNNLNRRCIFKKAYSELKLIRAVNSDRSGEDAKKKIQEIMNSLPEMAVNPDYHEQKWRLKVNTLYYMLSNKPQQFYLECEKLYKLSKANLLDYRENTEDMIVTLDMLLLSCDQINKLEMIESYAPEYLKLSKSGGIGTKIKRKAIFSFYLNMINVKLMMGELTSALTLVDEFIASHPRSFYKVYEINFLSTFAIVHFCGEDYEKALDFVEEIAALKTPVRKDIQMIIYSLKLILHYELNNFLILEPMIRSTNRYIKKEFLINPIEKTLQTLIKHLVSSPDKKKKIALISSFREELAMEAKQFENSSQSVYHILLTNWCDSKIKQLPMAKVYKHNYLNQNTIS